MGTEEQNPPPAGWYADPEGGAGQMRYWDGARWTEHRHDPAGATAPVPAPPRLRPPRRPRRPRARPAGAGSPRCT